ncbi:MAG TPA: glutathione S-transferase [Burkholderiaceae bacterium]
MTTSTPAQPIKLHNVPISGHCHRVQLFASLLGLPVELVPVDLARGAHKTPEYLALNAFGQVPVIQDGEVTLADSNAILVYLARTYGGEAWLPLAPRHAAEVQRWLSVAAGQLAYGPAAARIAMLFKRPYNEEELQGRARALFSVMEQVLQARPFLTGDTPTLADVANYSYVRVAPEGNVSLVPYPAIQAWLARIEALPGFVPMPRSPVGLPA